MEAVEVDDGDQMRLNQDCRSLEGVGGGSEEHVGGDWTALTAGADTVTGE